MEGIVGLISRFGFTVSVIHRRFPEELDDAKPELLRIGSRFEPFRF
jgi:hypothetical protein